MVDTVARYFARQSGSTAVRLVGGTGRRELRSSHNYTCASVTTSTRFGDRAFAAAGPRLWNSLTADVRRHSRNFLPEVEDVFVWSRRQHLVTVVLGAVDK